MRIEDLDLNIPDSSAKEYAEALLEQLQALNDDFSTHAMSDTVLYLQGQKKMLHSIITYIKRTL